MKPAESKPFPLVMIADNDDEERCILKAILKLKGFKVVEAADGQEAINLATEATPDLLHRFIQRFWWPAFTSCRILGAP